MSNKEKQKLLKELDNANCGEEDVDVNLLQINEDNFRDHPEIQEKVWQQYRQQVPFLGRIVVNKINNKIIEGNYRAARAKYIAKELNQVVKIPVQWVELDEETEKLALAYYNMIGELATINQIKHSLLSDKIKLIGQEASKAFQRLADTERLADQLNKKMQNSIEDEEDFNYQSSYVDFDDEEDLVFPNLDLQSSKQAKSTTPKIKFNSEQAEQFRQLLKKSGQANLINESVFIVILGRGGDD